MVGLLVQYLDEAGGRKEALFQGTKEKAQENIDRYFTEGNNEKFVSSVTATESTKYDHIIMDEWTTPYYGSDMDKQTAACVVK